MLLTFTRHCRIPKDSVLPHQAPLSFLVETIFFFPFSADVSWFDGAKAVLCCTHPVNQHSERLLHGPKKTMVNKMDSPCSYEAFHRGVPHKDREAQRGWTAQSFAPKAMGSHWSIMGDTRSWSTGEGWLPGFSRSQTKGGRNSLWCHNSYWTPKQCSLPINIYFF